MTTLTNNEIKALKLCLNYDDREAQLSDNYSNAGVDEFAANLFNGNKQAAGGLITSLNSKGLGDHDDEDGIFWLSEKGVHTICDIIEKEAAPETMTYGQVAEAAIDAKELEAHAETCLGLAKISADSELFETRKEQYKAAAEEAIKARLKWLDVRNDFESGK